MPMPDSTFSRIWYPGSTYNKSFSNYLVEFTGIIAEKIPDGANRSPFTLTWKPLDSKQPPIVLNVWLLRTLEKSTSVYVCGIYNPINDKTAPLSLALGTIGWATRIGGINALVPNIERQVKDAQIAAKGMLVLRKAMQSLQRKRGDEMSAEAFHQIAFEALPIMLEKGINKLSQKKLGKHLGFNEDTISKYLSREPGLYTELQTEFKRLLLLR